MSRSGYVDSDESNALQIAGFQASVRRMMRGRQGQRFLWELYLALEALPTKELIVGGLVDDNGCACALGAVALSRGIQIRDDSKAKYDEDGDLIDDDDYCEIVAPLLGIKKTMAREIMYANDEGDDWHWPDGTVVHNGVPWKLRDTPIRREDTNAERWQRMRRWVVSRLQGIP